MATHHPMFPILPFPDEIDRADFGHWISGFTDGEGCFGLGWKRKDSWKVPYIRFSINLRADDINVLRLIQSFLGTGLIHLVRRTIRIKDNLTAAYVADGQTRALKSIIPHFEQFPLHAKKKHDFVIWKEGVLLANQVVKRHIKGRGLGGGTYPRWLKCDIAKFDEIIRRLKETRRYKHPDSDIAVPSSAIATDDDFPLFSDG